VVAVMIDASSVWSRRRIRPEMMRQQKKKEPQSKRFAILNKIDLLKKTNSCVDPAVQRHRPVSIRSSRLRIDRRWWSTSW